MAFFRLHGISLYSYSWTRLHCITLDFQDHHEEEPRSLGIGKTQTCSGRSESRKWLQKVRRPDKRHRLLRDFNLHTSHCLDGQANVTTVFKLRLFTYEYVWLIISSFFHLMEPFDWVASPVASHIVLLALWFERDCSKWYFIKNSSSFPSSLSVSMGGLCKYAVQFCLCIFLKCYSSTYWHR